MSAADTPTVTATLSCPAQPDPAEGGPPASRQPGRVAYDAPGLPRPRHQWRWAGSKGRCPHLPDTLPVPWINGPCVRDDNDWHGFRADAHRAHHERLCVVCGLPLGPRLALGSMRGRRETAGPGGHPRCILLAAQRCPHLAGRQDPSATVAFDYVGPGVGYTISPEQLADGWGCGEDIVDEARPLTRSELRELARRDPWGIEPDPHGELAQAALAAVRAYVHRPPGR